MNKKKISLEGKTLLITGVAGFIGSFLAKRLISSENDVRIIGVDDLNDYYSPGLKKYRLSEVNASAAGRGVYFKFIEGDISDKNLIDRLFAEYRFDIVVNLAAQAGVRYSVDHPDKYIKSNVIGFYNILEACRHSYDNGSSGVEHLVYASSSSVYGGNKKIPFCTSDLTDSPVSLYAATKKSNELFAHAYSKLYGIPSTGLRFFTVYGEEGRPDMFYYSATEKLLRGEDISIYNYGHCRRDFTYISDVVEGVYRVIQGAPQSYTDDNGDTVPPCAVYNIGGGRPENLLDFIDVLQKELVRAGVLDKDFDFERHKKLVAMQPGDVAETYADTVPLQRDYGFTPQTDIRAGLRKFAEWYKKYNSNIN